MRPRRRAFLLVFLLAIVVAALAAPGTLLARALAPRGTHAFTILSSDTPRLLVMDNEIRVVKVTVRNDGTEAWDPDSGYGLSYHWRTPLGRLVQRDGARTPFARRVLPGDTVTLDAELDLPPSTGLYQLEWDMVQENVTWFSERDPAPLPRSLVLVLPAAATAAGALPLVPALIAIVGYVALRRTAGQAATERRAAWSVKLAATLPAWDLVWCATSLFAKQVGALSATHVEATASALTASAVTALAPAALLFGVLPAGPRRAWAAWLVSAFGSLVLLADVVYFRYFGDVLSTAAVAAASQSGYLTASIRSLLRPQDAWLAVDLLAALPLAARLGRARFGPSPWRIRAAVPLGLAVVLLMAVPSPLSAGLWRAPGEGIFRHLNVVQEMGVFGYHGDDVMRYVRARVLKPAITPEQLRDARAWFDARASQRAGVGPYFGAARGRNVIFLLVESLQGFVVGLRVNGQEVTPNLNRLRAESLWSAGIVDQAGEGRTSDAELLNATSLLPLPHGAAAFLSAGTGFVALPDLLRSRGYSTASAVAFDPSFWNRRVTHAAYGFDRSYFASDFAPGERVGWGLNDRGFVQQMLPRLRAMPRPFCAWMITLSLHHPFDSFPASLEVLDLGRWNGTRFGNYLHGMHLFDAALGDLVDGLRRDGLLDETMLVVEGDHEAGVDWADVAKASSVERDTVGWYMADRVPVLVRVPGPAAPHGEIPVVAGQSDIPPTVLGLLGIDPGPLPFVGRNLLGRVRDVPVVRRYGDWIDARHLYLSGQGYTSQRSCIDLATRQAVALSACAPGEADAERQQQASNRVLTFGLQHDLIRTGH